MDRDNEHGICACKVRNVGEHDAEMSMVTATLSRIDLTGGCVAIIPSVKDLWMKALVHR